MFSRRKLGTKGALHRPQRRAAGGKRRQKGRCGQGEALPASVRPQALCRQAVAPQPLIHDAAAGVRKCPFGLARRPVPDYKTACFNAQNGPNGNAKWRRRARRQPSAKARARDSRHGREGSEDGATAGTKPCLTMKSHHYPPE